MNNENLKKGFFLKNEKNAKFGSMPFESRLRYQPETWCDIVSLWRQHLHQISSKSKHAIRMVSDFFWSIPLQNSCFDISKNLSDNKLPYFFWEKTCLNP
jgi:hypothetical protein